jgi:hypothetical protein
MLALLARKYIYRYVLLAIALPVLARLCLFGADRLERRHGAPTKAAALLRKIGAVTQRRANRAMGKPDTVAP